jgi:nitrate reductase gamma subunit
MIFDLTLYASLLIFLLGLCYRISAWFRTAIGLSPAGIDPSARVMAAVRGLLGAVTSPKILGLLKVFFLDILLQFRILRDKKDTLVWLMHICIYGGFTLLLLMHALDKFIAARLFDEYYSTLNPFMFLRNLFGLVFLAGLILAVIRRIRLRVSGLSTTPMDIFAIALLSVVVVSGFLLEAAKISSFSAYGRMVDEYAALKNQEEAKALEVFWVKQFGVVSPSNFQNVSKETLEQGRQLSEMSCAGCHSNPRWAFLSFAAAKITKPVAYELDKAGYPQFLWYLHFLSCFFGLAYLPFSKFFHIISTPVSLLVNAAAGEGHSSPANLATKLSIELDGCKHGGACHDGCPIQMKRIESLEAASKQDAFYDYFQKSLHLAKKSTPAGEPTHS